MTPGGWGDIEGLGSDLSRHGVAYLVLFLAFGLLFSVAVKSIGFSLREFLPGYVLLFLGSLIIFLLAATRLMKHWHLGAPLLALIIGLVIGNLRRLPRWFHVALRTEFYIKTGIVLLGATLPLTLIRDAGPYAFLQATIVSIVTWTTIYLAATRLFRLDPRFGAVLGAGGAVCGVSASIAVGGAVKADKNHIAISIGVVSIWAIAMIFTLSILTKLMLPTPEQPPASDATAASFALSPGEAGAWIGTSEFADAAGFAVVAEIAGTYGDAPIHTFTLMKVIGRGKVMANSWKSIRNTRTRPARCLAQSVNLFPSVTSGSVINGLPDGHPWPRKSGFRLFLGRAPTPVAPLAACGTAFD